MTDEPGKELAPRPEPPQMDPEQLRQFQEFQRFQEYQRYQQATGQAPQAPQQHQPRTGKRWWLIVLGSRIFWRALTFLTIVIAALLIYDNYFGNEDPGDTASDSGGVTGAAQGLPSPAGLQGTVGMFYKHVSFADTTRACTLMIRDDTRKKFATANGANDCAAAVQSLKAKVTNVDRYQQVLFPAEMLKTPTTNKVTIDSCSLTVEGGPRLGSFVVEKINAGWVIVDWNPSTCG